MVARTELKKRITSGGNYFSSPKIDLHFVPTGCKTLDLALGGGWAEGRIANIVGDKSTGKTLLCMEAAANFAIKHPNGQIRYREAEAAFDRAYAEALGMPMDRVDFGDEPFETIEDLFEDLTSCIKKATHPELYICDSLDALSDRAELKRGMDEGTYGTEKARKLSQLFRRLVREMHSSKLTLIIVSQIRAKIGITFGRTTTRSGGRALDFYASQVLFLSQIGTISKTISSIRRPVGLTIKAKVDKNKVGLPYREATFQLSFGYGIDDVNACLSWLDEAGGLFELKLTTAKLKEFKRALRGMEDDEFQSVVASIHAAVERQWYDIEKRFIPTRRKYG